MASQAPKSAHVHFGAFELDTQTGELNRSGILIHLAPQPFKVLSLLASRPGELVTREEIREQIWGRDTFVDFEHGLNVAIKEIRDAIGDEATAPRFIETLPRRGYRFIAPANVIHGRALEFPVRHLPLDSHEPGGHHAAVLNLVERPASDSSTQLQVRGRRKALIASALGAAAAVVVVSVGFWHLHQPAAPRISGYVQVVRDSLEKLPIGTDGARLYVDDLESPYPVAYADLAGGQFTHIPIALPDPWILALSPEGSSLLVASDNPGLWTVRVQDGALRRILDSRVNSAVWSHDGKMVVFSTFAGDIDVMQNDGGNVRTLAPHVLANANRSDAYRSQSANDLTLSPDGMLIRFTRERRYWEVSSNGTGLHELLPGWRPDFGQCCGHWTAAGNLFVFVAGESVMMGSVGQPSAQLFVHDERRGTFRQAHAEPVQLTSGPIRWGTPIPSTDGKKIYSRGIVLHGQLVRFDKQSHEFRPYLGGISAEFVAFAPDRRSLVYVTFPDGILWRANSDGTGRVQLTSPPFYPKQPHWSPDGSRILFYDTDAKGRSQGYIIPAGGGTPEPIIPNSTELQDDTNWAPDGKRIVYSSGLPGGRRCIKILDLATHETKTIPSSEGRSTPRWSPDGRYIAALASPPDSLTVFDFRTQKWSDLESDWDAYPAWSRDGQFIYFESQQDGFALYRIRPIGGKTERVLDLSGVRQNSALDGWIGLDPDDMPMLMRDVGSDDIYALTLDQR